MMMIETLVFQKSIHRLAMAQQSASICDALRDIAAITGVSVARMFCMLMHSTSHSRLSGNIATSGPVNSLISA